MASQPPNPVTISLTPQTTTAGSAFQPVIGESITGLLAFLGKANIVPPTGSSKVRGEALRILQQSAAPTQASARRVGLVCGYVQSGKTVSIESVSALGKDNGYRAVILLAGVTTILLDQSADRMEEELRAGAGGYDWHMLKNPTPADRQHLETLLQNWRNTAPGTPSSRMLFVTVMKNHRHLDHLSELLELLPMEGIPALVVDDEADQASLNTRPLQPTPSTTYLCIERLRRALPHHTLLQYTATPQAPLLISRIDSLSADFADLVEPGEGYAGGQKFFHERRGDLVRDIPQTEIFDHTNLPADPPLSLIEAMQVFLVGVAAVPRSEQIHHRSMLVHPHQRREVHDAYYDWIHQILQDWYRTLISPTDPDRAELLREFEACYGDLQRTGAQLPAFAQVAAVLAEAINRVVLTKVNSDNGKEIKWNNGYAHILVGGEKLGRGYTVKGLTVTYMPRGPGGFNADTIQQRARFFGYHAKPGSSYLDLCRVYLDPQVAQIFQDYVDHEEDLRSQVEKHRGQPLKNLKRAFLLDSAMRPTRHNIMTRLYDRTRLSGGWFEQRAPHASAGSNNRELVNALISKLNFTTETEFNRHAFLEVQLSSLLTNFLVAFETPDDRDALPMMAILMTLAGACEKSPDETCRLYLMDPSMSPFRLRTLGQNDSEIALMQGRSSATGPGRYPGDRAFSDDARVSVQIHRLRIARDMGPGNAPQVLAEDVPALAIRLPPRLSGDLADIIVQGHN
jgi:hypothetical protein